MNDVKISLRGVRKNFGSKQVLQGVDLDIYAHKTTTIFGLSGGGKSTIIKHIVGLLHATSGKIYIDGEELLPKNETNLFRIRKKIGFLFQSGALFDYMNVSQNVEFPLIEHTNMARKKRKEKIIKTLELVGLKPKEVLKLFPHELSGGMRKRVGLARTIILDPQIILYDEPTSGLDPISSDRISQMIKKLQKELDVTSVLISHDIKESFKCSDYIAMLYEGKIIEFASVDDFAKTKNEICQRFLDGDSSGEIIKIQD